MSVKNLNNIGSLNPITFFCIVLFSSSSYCITEKHTKTSSMLERYLKMLYGHSTPLIGKMPKVYVKRFYSLHHSDPIFKLEKPSVRVNWVQ